VNQLQRIALWLARLEPSEQQARITDRADTIKELAVITAVPRWVGALLLAEGFNIPISWLGWWKPLSALLAMAMAGVEGWAFSYIFGAWRKQGGNKLLFLFAMVAGVVFISVLTPFIVLQTQATGLSDVLSGSGLWIWAASVASSTIVIVAGVGYAQMDKDVMVERHVHQDILDQLELAWADLDKVQLDDGRRIIIDRLPGDERGLVARLALFDESILEGGVLNADNDTIQIGRSLANVVTMIAAGNSNADIYKSTGVDLKEIIELRG